MKRALALGGALAVAIVLLAACDDGDSVPEPPTRVTATAVRVAPSPTPTRTATPRPEHQVPLSEPELAALVPGTESIESTFADLRLNTQHAVLLTTRRQPTTARFSVRRRNDSSPRDGSVGTRVNTGTCLLAKRASDMTLFPFAIREVQEFYAGIGKSAALMALICNGGRYSTTAQRER